MQEIKEQPTTASEATDGLEAAALRAEAWAGEPFLREGEDPAVSLAPGTSRRRALDDALAGMLTELIASHEKEANGNGNGNGAVAEAVEDDAETEPEEDSTEDVL